MPCSLSTCTSALCLRELFKGMFAVPSLHTREGVHGFSWSTQCSLWLILTDTSQCLLLMIVLQKLNWLECNSPCSTSASGQYFSWKFLLEQPVIFKKHYIFLFNFFAFLPTLEDLVSSILKYSYFYSAIIRFPYPCPRHWSLMVYAKGHPATHSTRFYVCKHSPICRKAK